MYGTFLGGLGQLPIMGGKDRQSFPSRTAVRQADSMGGLLGGQMPQGMPSGMPPGLGNTSRSIFDAYMSQAFNQIHTPPPIPGIYGMHPGGYSGFFGRQLPQLPQAQQQPVQPVMPYPGYVDPNNPGYIYGENR